MKKNNMQHILMSMILEDLQSLQEPTEEREVEIKRGEDSMGICPLCDEYQFPKQKYCSDCGAKIKRIP